MVGATLVTTPSAGQQTPSTGIGFALQLAVVPPFVPAHDQVQGPFPLTTEGVPTLQRPVFGFDATLVPFVGPQTPFTGVLYTALQVGLWFPPFCQLHFQL